MHNIRPKIKLFKSESDVHEDVRATEKQAEAFCRSIQDQGGLAWVTFLANQHRDNPIRHDIYIQANYFTPKMVEKALS